MSKLIKYLNKIERFLRDEYTLHALMMFFIATIILSFPLYKGEFIVILVSTFIAIGWEKYQNISKGTPENVWDVIATIIGGILAIIINLLKH